MIISMKRYALLRLENNTNKVVFDCHASDLALADEPREQKLFSFWGLTSVCLSVE